MLDVKIFAKRLSEERKKQKLTQSELSKKAQVSVQMISSYEKGTKLPSLESAVNLCNALNLCLDCLCSEPHTHEDETQSLGQIKSLADIVSAIDLIKEGLVSVEKSCIISHDEDNVIIKIENCKDLAKYYSQLERLESLLDDDAISNDIVKTWQKEAANQLRKKSIEMYELFGW